MRSIRENFFRFFVDGIDARQLWRRYLIGLGLIIALLFGSHLASSWAILAADKDAAVINESGRQRMLSQRILYFTASIIDHNPANARQQLTAAIDLFETSHARLSLGAELSEALRAQYFGDAGGASLDALVRAFIADARMVAAPGQSPEAMRAALLRMEAIGPGELLKRLDGAVKLYETEAQARSAQIAAFQNYSIYLAILTILIEAVVIFLPAQLAARRSLDRLEQQKSELKTARAAEKRKNDELAALRRAAEHEALHDPLTGLANRRYLERHLMRVTAELRGGCEGVAVLHVDLDRFKQINDTLGHAAGDFVLEHVAQSLRDFAGPDDFVARVGGDEFVVITRFHEDRSRLEAIADGIIKQLAKPLNYEGEMCRFGASIGIDIGISAETGPEIDPTLLLSNADIALYRAKGLGRGRFAFFCEDLRAEVELSKELSDDLTLALSRREFGVKYHPIICARSGAVEGVEAAPCWAHPERGEVGPEIFLPIADRLGVTDQIDEIALRQALADLAAWDASALKPLDMSVNVSARLLRCADLPQRLATLQPPPGRFAIEVAETAFAETLSDVERLNLDLISERGVALEIDDFGAGRASLAALIAHAPRRLKLAGELVAELPGGETHRRLAQAVVEIAAALEVDVVALGVQTAEQHAVLAQLGCARLQGPHYATAMTANDVAAMLAARGAATG